MHWRAGMARVDLAATSAAWPTVLSVWRCRKLKDCAVFNRGSEGPGMQYGLRLHSVQKMPAMLRKSPDLALWRSASAVVSLERAASAGGPLQEQGTCCTCPAARDLKLARLTLGVCCRPRNSLGCDQPDWLLLRPAA